MAAGATERKHGDEEPMNAHICPWWMGYFLANPLRRLVQNPRKILQPFVREGMTILEPGPGMGFFTFELARLVGESGRVISVDVQAKMIQKLKESVERSDLAKRIDLRLSSTSDSGISDLSEQVDFVFAFAVIHEIEDPSRFFGDVARVMKPGADLLMAEPSMHVKDHELMRAYKQASEAGLDFSDIIEIPLSRALLLKKKALVQITIKDIGQS